MKISIIIPVFNEEFTILKVLKKIKEVQKNISQDFEIIVINDGSTDQTKAILESFEGITLINHETNQGIGGATKTGIKKAFEMGAEYIIKFDGDGRCVWFSKNRRGGQMDKLFFSLDAGKNVSWLFTEAHNMQA